MANEQKVKAYDEALERARQQRDDYQKELDKTDKNSQLADILRAGISAVEMVFPQLKESDDERVRKDIIDHFESIKAGALYDNQEGSDNIISSCNEKIAYLEKQKEETENATKTLAKILEDSAEGFRRILKKKGIDYEVSDKFWENEAGVYSKEENVKFHKWMDDLMGPTPVEETNAYKKRLEAGMKQKEQKPVSISCGHENDAEWGQEDKEKIVTISEIIEHCTTIPYSGGTLTLNKEYKKELLCFIKSLRPQPHKDIKFEPKEGDVVVNKDGVIAIFDCWGHHPDGGSCNDHSYFFAKCTLDDNCYNEIDCHPDSFGLRYATLEEIRQLVPYLLASSQPHWKPSEHQMNILKAVKEYVGKGSGYWGEGLGSLIDDLEKLT